jgi:hypothetical protein
MGCGGYSSTGVFGYPFRYGIVKDPAELLTLRWVHSGGSLCEGGDSSSSLQ